MWEYNRGNDREKWEEGGEGEISLVERRGEERRNVHFSISAARFRIDSRRSGCRIRGAARRGDRLCKYYASGAIVRSACVLCSACGLCKYTAYANRSRGLNACSQPRVSSSARRRILRSLHSSLSQLSIAKSPLDKCHRFICKYRVPLHLAESEGI